MKNTKNKESSGKEAVNRKTSIIFIQLGLVFALLLTYIAIESKTIIKDDGSQANFTSIYEDDDTFIPDTTPEPPKEQKEEPKAKKELVFDVPIIIKEGDDQEETDFDSDIFDVDTPTKVEIPDDDEYVDIKEEDPEDVPFLLIEDAPIFPGCTGTKEEMKKCFSKSINKLVARKFNVDLAQDLGLSEGKKRIRVQFVVDKNGMITNIEVRGPHKRLEKEAKRVVSLLPKMIAGKQRGRAVGVKFYLPITFLVQ